MQKNGSKVVRINSVQTLQQLQSEKNYCNEGQMPVHRSKGYIIPRKNNILRLFRLKLFLFDW